MEKNRKIIALFIRKIILCYNPKSVKKVGKMGFLKRYFFNTKSLATKFSLFYIISGILGIILLDRIIKVFSQHNDLTQSPLPFGFAFLLLTGSILFIMLNHMQKVIQRIDNSYKDLKEKDKQRLLPYEFALNNSVDAIYWFTLDAKFIYVVSPEKVNISVRILNFSTNNYQFEY